MAGTSHAAAKTAAKTDTAQSFLTCRNRKTPTPSRVLIR